MRGSRDPKSVHSLLMLLADQVKIGRADIQGKLFHALAAGDNARDRRVLEAPRQRPCCHRHAGRHFSLGDPLYSRRSDADGNGAVNVGDVIALFGGGVILSNC